MRTAQDWITALNLQAHVEGGYFRQVYKSSEETRGGSRALFTSIYFLLEKDNPSNFHRLNCDELWYYHSGNPLTVHMIYPNGSYESVVIGPDLTQGQVLSHRVPRGVIFGSSVDDGFALVSCLCAPGFEYDDFELFNRQELLEKYPQYEEIINQLTPPD